MNDESAKLLSNEDALEILRRRRAEAINAARGIWSDRKDLPKDGVQHQESLRQEWESE